MEGEEALKVAGSGAVDAVIFAEQLAEQHRDVMFPVWVRDSLRVYPYLEGEPLRLYDAEGFEAVERVQLERLLRRIERTRFS